MDTTWPVGISGLSTCVLDSRDWGKLTFKICKNTTDPQAVQNTEDRQPDALTAPKNFRDAKLCFMSCSYNDFIDRQI